MSPRWTEYEDEFLDGNDEQFHKISRKPKVAKHKQDAIKAKRRQKRQEQESCLKKNTTFESWED